MELPSEVMDLFLLEWPKNPDLLEANRKAQGVNHQVAEQAAWCMEFNEQVAFLAAQLGLTVGLMGGNGVSLRLEASKQRGSADNDYLTNASEEDIERLMQAIAERFAAAPEPFFRPTRLMPPEGAQELPLRSYTVPVPDLLPGYSRPPGALESFVKLEFHMKGELPDLEKLPEPHWSTNERIELLGPAMPYQIAMKLVTLVDPPVGIEAGRIQAIPKHLYDLDVLFALLLRESDWNAVGEQLAKQYYEECAQRKMSPSAEAPFDQISVRLNEWAECRDKGTIYWSTIQSMQSTQMQSRNRMIPDLWSARCSRLNVIILLLGNDSPFGTWQAILDQEKAVPIDLTGKPLREVRKALKAFGIPAADNFRAMFWPHVAAATTPDIAVQRAAEFAATVTDAKAQAA